MNRGRTLHRHLSQRGKCKHPKTKIQTYRRVKVTTDMTIKTIRIQDTKRKKKR